MKAEKAGDGGSNPPRAIPHSFPPLLPFLTAARDNSLMAGDGAKRHYKATPGNVLRIFRSLREPSSAESGGFITVSEIARRTGLHKWTVSRTIDLYMAPLLEVVSPPELSAFGLSVKLVKLRDPRLKPEQVISYLKLRRKIST
jgi:hypothetical protein